LAQSPVWTTTLAIDLATDIVLGVSRAADPEKLRTASARLRQLSEATAAAPPEQAGAFSQAVGSAPDAAPPAPATTTARMTTTTAAMGRVPERATRAAGAVHQLEAFVLQTFVQSMMPKHAETFFGKGTAGEIWKSMLSEKLGAQLAQSGKIGLAERLAAGLPAAHTDAAASAASAPLKRPALLEMLPYLASPIADKRS
jgi:Rod binding domain-containing protein